MNEQLELKVRSLIHLSSEHRKQLSQRISHEWKVLIVTLTFYVSLIGAKLSGKLKPLDDSAVMVIVVCSFFVGLASCGFILFLHQSNTINKKIAHEAEKSLISLIENSEIECSLSSEDLKIYSDSDDQRVKFSLNIRNWIALIWQATVIFSALVACVYIIRS